MRSITLAFLVALAVTAIIWLLRGLGLLTFIPGGLLWGLILLCVMTALLTVIR